MSKFEAKIVVNGESFDLNNSLLEVISENLIDDKSLNKLYHQLSFSPNSSVRVNISNLDNISYKTYSKLLKDKDLSVVDRLLANSKLYKFLKSDDLSSVIGNFSTELLLYIVRNIEEVPDNDEHLSIQKLLLSTENPVVKLELADSPLTSNYILKVLSNDSDLEISNKAKSNLGNC